MEHPIVGQRVDREKVQLAKGLRARQTDAEARLWSRLRRSQLGGLHFRRQQIILGYVVDFYCHAARLVVEVDGSAHDGQAEYDAARSERLTSLGLRVLRFRNAEVDADLPGVLARIAKLAERG